MGLQRLVNEGAAADEVHGDNQSLNSGAVSQAGVGSVAANSRQTRIGSIRQARWAAVSLACGMSVAPLSAQTVDDDQDRMDAIIISATRSPSLVSDAPLHVE